MRTTRPDCTYCTKSHRSTRTVVVAGITEHVCENAYNYILGCHAIDGTLDAVTVTA